MSPRFLLGEESLLFNGFPCCRTNLRCIGAQWSQSFLSDLSGNMVSLPVLLALVQSTLVAIPWQVTADAPEVADDSDVEDALSLFQSVVGPLAGSEGEGAKRPKTS